MRQLPALLGLCVALAAAGAWAAPPAEFPLEIQTTRFSPAELTVPSGMRIKLRVRNTRDLPSEFESFDLNREKIVPPGGTITVWIGPLSPGRYRIFDDFNPGTVGWIVARPDGSGESR